MNSKPASSHGALKRLLKFFDLERLDCHIFRGHSPQIGWQRIFGGQVVAQSLIAAHRTVGEGKNIHSLQGYFIRPGDPSIPVIYDVTVSRDGKSFATRYVCAIQHGVTIFSMSASFHKEEEGFSHGLSMPVVSLPEDIREDSSEMARFRARLPRPIQKHDLMDSAIDMRPAFSLSKGEKDEAVSKAYLWIRASGSLPSDCVIHRSLLAYASDISLLDSSLLPHGRTLRDSDLMLASLDHILWFHRSFRADSWLLYAQESPHSFGARGFNRGNIFSRDGTHIASVAQEGLIRIKS